MSPLELTRFLLDRIRGLNPSINAYITVSEELAIQAAKQAERELCIRGQAKSRQDRGPLHGIPISLKDNIYTKGIRTTAGSKVLEHFVPRRDAPLVTALQRAGAVILGKTNMHEFAYGATTENPHFGTTRNPWDTQRIAGGSSGGSAAALAAGLCYGSIGTDTGGSIRIPASCCGVVGLKPGTGRVTAEDVVALAPTLDVVGPLARGVQDAALLLQVITATPPRWRAPGGHDALAARLSTSQRRKVCLGIPKEFFLEVLDPEVRAAFEAALRLLRNHGARLKNVSLPLSAETENARNNIAWVEATQYHQHSGWFPQRAADYSDEVYKRLELGAKVTALEYLQAQTVRENFKQQLIEAFAANGLHALVVPTTPIPAPLIGQATVAIQGHDYPTRALLLRLNHPANLAGVPAITVPCGLTKTGLPIGLQFISLWSKEASLLQVAHGFEQQYRLPAYPQLQSPDEN